MNSTGQSSHQQGEPFHMSVRCAGEILSSKTLAFGVFVFPRFAVSNLQSQEMVVSIRTIINKLLKKSTDV